MASPNKRADKDEVVVVTKPSFRERLPKILLGMLVGLNGIAMIGGTLMIYKLKIAYHRPTITEQSES